jgi:WD40 repeat protein
MLGWSGNDQKIVTTGSDHLVRVWDWKSGQMIRKMEGHTGEVFVIKTHPIHDDLMFTAGHDGVLMVIFCVSTLIILIIIVMGYFDLSKRVAAEESARFAFSSSCYL